MSDETVGDFTIHVEDAVLADLRERLARTRWPDQLPGAGWDLGTELGYLRELCAEWGTSYDWRAAEAELNSWPQLVTTVDGQRVHAIHARSPHPGALPLLLTHGWPGSVVEFLDVLGPLTDPPAHGGEAADAFHVVAPSLPGYAWSGPTTQRGWHVERVARAWAELMQRLGYDAYGAQGGDWGSLVTARLGTVAPERLVGIHLTLTVADPPADRDDEALPPADREALAARRRWQREETGYSAIQGTRPQSLAYGLVDSPAGLAGWVVEKFRAWSDCGGDLDSAVSRDRLLTNLTTYWVTGTAGSSARLYYESVRAGMFGGPGRGHRIEVPTGVANFPGEIWRSPRAWVQAQYDLRHWTEHERGGHFAALEQPAALVADIREFFRPLRRR